MSDLYVDLGNGNSAVIPGTGNIQIVETPDVIQGNDATWNITPHCQEQCDELGIPTNGDGTITGIQDNAG